MERKLFTIARDGELIEERLHALPMARVALRDDPRLIFSLLLSCQRIITAA